jgi:acetyltransferase-like isoleucine patch superfamily enzyme
MTQKELMLKGEYYDSSDKELTDDRRKAKKLCKIYNNLEVEDFELKKNILKELFQTNETPHIEPNFWCDYGYNIKFGKKFYSNHNLTILDVNTVTFGDNVLCGPNVQIYTAGHPLDAIERASGIEFGKPIVIGDNVWIGGGAIILPNITVGNNVVIAAGSVVTKDVPHNVVVGGNPARIIKNL